MSNTPIVIRRGDWWCLTTNNGTISRSVRSVAMGTIYYIAGGKMCRCSIESFRRWARAASLESADNWEGRNPAPPACVDREGL